ncbi:MAG: hypothetical protein JW929_04070 [Anaerolineales bacterium]|nr:hypothetical protein [Anaerolineales bacterium]
MPDARYRGEADSLPLPIPLPKDAPSGQAVDPSDNEQLKRRKQKDAGDVDSAAGK